MSHTLYTVIRFKHLKTYTLEVEFDDGVTQVIDFEPLLKGEVFGPLRDPDLFKQVRIEPDFKNLVWPNDAELDPEILHDWPKHQAEMEERANAWAKVTA